MVQSQVGHGTSCSVFEARLRQPMVVKSATALIVECYVIKRVVCLHLYRDLRIGNFRSNRISNRIGGYNSNLNRISNQIGG